MNIRDSGKVQRLQQQSDRHLRSPVSELQQPLAAVAALLSCMFALFVSRVVRNKAHHGLIIQTAACWIQTLTGKQDQLILDLLNSKLNYKLALDRLVHSLHVCAHKNGFVVMNSFQVSCLSQL